MARRSKGGRTKDGRILVRIGADSRKRLARNAALEKAASDRAIRKEAKKAATRLRRSQREIAKRAMQLARRLARERARDAKRAAKRAGNNKPTEEYNRQREENARKKRKKRPFHPRGPYATERYTSYARRLERSRKLKASRTSPTTFTCNGYTIKVTAGSDPKPLSCTCPDFTQIEGSRNWLGSKAGPFNPCKHMLAVEELTGLVEVTTVVVATWRRQAAPQEVLSVRTITFKNNAIGPVLGIDFSPKTFRGVPDGYSYWGYENTFLILTSGTSAGGANNGGSNSCSNIVSQIGDFTPTANIRCDARTDSARITRIKKI